MVISIKYNEPKGSTVFLLNETRQGGDSLQQLGTFCLPFFIPFISDPCVHRAFLKSVPRKCSASI